MIMETTIERQDDALQVSKRGRQQDLLRWSVRHWWISKRKWKSSFA